MKPLLTDVEFEALPPSVQRKYFSSLERLRIAEETAIQYAKVRHSTEQSHRQPLCPIQQSKALLRNNSTARNRLRKAAAILQQENITPAQAQWYLSLPPKLRRQHFSREEQTLLAGRCETSLLDSRPGSVSRPQTQQRSRRPSDISHLSHLSHLSRGEQSSVSDSRSLSRRRSFSDVSSHNPDSAGGAPPLPEIDWDSALILPDAMSPPPHDGPKHSRRPSFRRAMSMSTNSFLRTSQSPTPSSSAPPSAAPTRAGTIKRPRAFSHSSHTRSRPSISLDPTAAHYQDPEARMKLRQYLASPQKFDEAIEFGFPSSAAESLASPPPMLPPTTARRPMTVEAKASRDVQTFLRAESISYIDASEDDVEDAVQDDDAAASDSDTLEGSDYPATPSDVAAHFREYDPSSPFTALDFSNLPDLALRSFPADPFSPSSALFPAAGVHREMTLRMTLTRPDLRAKEEDIYGWQQAGPQSHQPAAAGALPPLDVAGGGKDPLALDELPPLCEDATGRHGAFAVGAGAGGSVGKQKGGIMGRILSRVKRTRSY